MTNQARASQVGKGLRMAIVQEYLTRDGGAENCFAEFVNLFPEADLYAFFTLDPEDAAGRLKGRKLHESWIAPLARKLPNYRFLFPLFPRLAKSFDLRDADLVLSSSFSLAKAVRLRPGQVHVCYCYTPPRWLWDMSEEYLQSVRGGSMAKRAARRLMDPLRKEDLRAAGRVDVFIAISEFVRARIKRVYHRDATVVYPPVAIERFQGDFPRKDYYFTLGRLVPYKNVHLMVEAFAKMPDRRLVVGGGGPELERLRAMATPNVTFLGRVPDEDIARRMGEAKAFIFAAEEDFGIAPVEAQAAGTPVVALGRGGALETVIDGVTGVFFQDATSESLIQGIENLEALLLEFSRQAIRDNAKRFSTSSFRRRVLEVMANATGGFLSQ